MKDKLLKRARKKFLSSIITRELCKIENSPLTKAYRISTACCNQLIVDSDQVLRSSFFCKRRWCQTCASISMSIQIDNYMQPLSKYEDLYFVTLTRKSVSEEIIAATINEMQKSWRKILDLARKQQRSMIGVRKLELKVGKGGYGYHPHYHIIVNGKDNAQWLVAQWLKRSTTSKKVAQDLRKVNNLESAVVELMKYATKLTCADKADNNILCTPYQMDIIFRALHRKRLFQPFGGLKVERAEDDFEVTSEIVMKAQGLYEWIGHDWYHSLYGQPLTNYVPEGSEVQIYKNYHKK